MTSVKKNLQSKFMVLKKKTGVRSWCDILWMIITHVEPQYSAISNNPFIWYCVRVRENRIPSVKYVYIWPILVWEL